MFNLDSKSAWVFPGVGVKLSGFESRLYKRHKAVFAATFQRLTPWGGLDALQVLEAEQPVLPSGLAEQIFSYGFSIGMLEVLKEKYPHPAVLGGNSFGVYAALVAGGWLDIEPCAELLVGAYRSMEKAALEHGSSLCVPIGLETAECEACFQRLGLKSVLRINSNNYTCHVVCGMKSEITLAAEAFVQAGALSAAILALALPYHHPQFTREVSAEFGNYARTLPWKSGTIPLVSTLDNSILKNTAAVMDFAARQIFEPIDWSNSLIALYKSGINHFIECGPGISLTQNARFIDGLADWDNCKSLSKD